MNLKFLYPLLGLCAGIFIAFEFFDGLWFGALCLGLGIAIYLCLTMLSKNPVRSFILNKYHAVWICLFFTGIGALDIHFFGTTRVDTDITQKNLHYTGIVKDIKYDTRGDRLNVKVLSIQDSVGHPVKSENLNILLKTDGFPASKGDIVSFEAKPNKFAKSDPSSNYALRMHRAGFDYYANVYGNGITRSGTSNGIFKFFQRERENLAISLENSSLNRNTADFLISILLGDKSFLPSATREKVSSAGMAHILALSGLHVSIVYTIFLTVLLPLSFLGLSKQRKILAIGLVWIYVILTGASPSTVRAAIMATFIAGALLLQRKNVALNSLLAAALIILIFNPLYIYDIGLQLSFVSVGALIIFIEKLNPIDHHLHPKTFKTINLILVTLVATMATWTLVAYYFGNVPSLFLITNVLLLPFLPFFVAGGFIYLVLLKSGVDFTFLATLLDLFHDFFIGAADILSLSGKSTVKMNVEFPTLICWLAGLLILGYSLHAEILKKKRIARYLGGVLVTFSIILQIFPFSQEISASRVNFKHSFTKLEAEARINTGNYNLTFPRGTISTATLEGLEILAVDALIHPDFLDKIKPDLKDGHKFLFVGPKADVTQIAGIANQGNFDKIILHSGVGKKKTEALRVLLEEEISGRIHSLGEKGSLDLDL